MIFKLIIFETGTNLELKIEYQKIFYRKICTLVL